MALRQVGAAPSTSDSLVDRSYVDPRTVLALRTTPSGSWDNPNSVISSTPAAPAAGTVGFLPHDVGNVAQPIQALGAFCTTAQSGGSTTITLAVYGDDGTRSKPLLTGGPLVSGTITATAGGRTTAVSMTLAARTRYWFAFLQVNATTPTTSPSFTSTSSVLSMWYGASTAIGAVGRIVQMTGQTAMPSSGTLITSTTNWPIVAFQAA